MEKNVLLPPVLVNKEFPFFLSLSLLTISQMNKINMKHPEFWCVCEREREGKRQRERQYRKNRKLRLWPQLCVSKAEWQCFVDPNTKSLSLPLYWFSVERGCVATKHYMCYWKLKWSFQRTDRTVVFYRYPVNTLCVCWIQIMHKRRLKTCHYSFQPSLSSLFPLNSRH